MQTVTQVTITYSLSYNRSSKVSRKTQLCHRLLVESQDQTAQSADKLRGNYVLCLFITETMLPQKTPISVSRLVRDLNPTRRLQHSCWKHSSTSKERNSLFKGGTSQQEDSVLQKENEVPNLRGHLQNKPGSTPDYVHTYMHSHTSTAFPYDKMSVPKVKGFKRKQIQ